MWALDTIVNTYLRVHASVVFVSNVFFLFVFRLLCLWVEAMMSMLDPRVAFRGGVTLLLIALLVGE